MAIAHQILKVSQQNTTVYFFITIAQKQDAWTKS